MLGSRGGVRAGMADVDGGGARRDNGTRGRWARAAGLWAATTTAAVLGDVELARWGEQGNGRRRHQKKQVFGGRAKEGERKYMGGLHPGQKVLLSRVVDSPGTKGVFGRAGKIPSPRPTFSPGWIYHPGQKGPVFPRFPPNLMFIFVSFYFSFKIGFHLLIQLIKL